LTGLKEKLLNNVMLKMKKACTIRDSIKIINFVVIKYDIIFIIVACLSYSPASEE